MIHPRFRDIVEIAGRYGVPDLWFPTNLLALTEPTAQALVKNGVATVAASIDGVTKETYEKIRVPAKFERLLACLDTLGRVRRAAGSKTPRLRIIFTWMKSNRPELALLPEFAADHGASEIDVRYVSPTEGVDVTPELLSGEDPAALNAELAAAAHDAVRRGLKLSSFPEFEPPGTVPRGLLVRARRRLWRLKAGMDRPEYLRYGWYQGLFGCAYPDRNYVIRPNGAVSPVHLLGPGSHRLLSGRRRRAHRGRRSAEADPGRAAHRQARGNVRHLRRAAHGALSARRHAAARGGRHRAAARAPRTLSRPAAVREAAAPRGSRRARSRETSTARARERPPAGPPKEEARRRSAPAALPRAIGAR